MRKIITHVQAGIKPSKEERRLESKEFQQYCQDFELLYTHKGILYRKVLVNEPWLGPNDRLCLPGKLQDGAMFWAHAHDSVGHLGIGATQNVVRKGELLVESTFLLINQTCAAHSQDNLQ